MLVKELSVSDLRCLLKRGTLCLDIYPFVVRVKSDVYRFASDLNLMYSDFNILDESEFADFHVSVTLTNLAGSFFRPIAKFCFDGRELFTRLPAYQSFTMLEWGLNWCIAAHSNQYLIIHAAVVERDGLAVVLPAPPGSGKSTLCIALVSRGWRLLSDELALLDLTSGLIFGMARPINLKNDSISIIKNFAPDLQFTSEVKNTTKGTVALVRPPEMSVIRRKEPAKPAWVICPRFEAGAKSSLSLRSKASTYMLVAEQSFNYDVHFKRGFSALGRLIGQCDCLDFMYSNLDEAIELFNGLLNNHSQHEKLLTD